MSAEYVRITNPTGFIPEVTSDPVNAPAQTAWVLKVGGPSGTPIGLLLALTYTNSYFFSYKTTEGTVIRTQLS